MVQNDEEKTWDELNLLTDSPPPDTVWALPCLVFKLLSKINCLQWLSHCSFIWKFLPPIELYDAISLKYFPENSSKSLSKKWNDGLVHIWGNPDPHWGPNSVYDIRIHLAYFILNGNGTGSQPLICCPLRNNFLKYLIIFWVCYSLMLSTWPSSVLVVKKRFLNNKRYVGGNVICWYMKREL